MVLYDLVNVFVVGFGFVFIYMVVFNINVINFLEKYRGKIVGGLNCFFVGSLLVFFVVFY